MARRHYSNVAPATTTSGSLTGSATSVSVASLTGWPAVPYTAALERGTSSEELVLVTAVVGTTATVTRGYGSTTGKSHASGVAFEHVVDATDADEANAHVNATSGVHGVTGSLVGLTDVQTLTNKTLSDSKGLATTTAPGLRTQRAGSGSQAHIVGLDAAGTGTEYTIAQGGHATFHNVTADTVTATGVTSSGPVSGTTGTFSGALSGASVTTAGAVTGGSVSTSGAVSGGSAAITGALTADSVNIGGGDFTVSNAGVVAASGAATFGGAVKGTTGGGRVATLTDAGTTTSAVSTEQLSSTNLTVSLTNGRRYRFTFQGVVGSTSTDGNSILPHLRIDSGSVTTSSTEITNAIVWSPLQGSIGRGSFTSVGEFVATSTGTWNLKASVNVRTGGGSGNAQLFGCTVHIDDVGV